MGGTTYFFHTSTDNSHASVNDSMSMTNSSIASYQVYPGTPSHVTAIKSRGGNSSFFLNDDIRVDMLTRNALTLMQSDPEQLPGKT